MPSHCLHSQFMDEPHTPCEHAMNLTVKLKLGLSFAALTLIVLLVSALAIVELAKFNRAFC